MILLGLGLCSCPRIILFSRGTMPLSLFPRGCPTRQLLFNVSFLCPLPLSTHHSRIWIEVWRCVGALFSFFFSFVFCCVQACSSSVFSLYTPFRSARCCNDYANQYTLYVSSFIGHITKPPCPETNIYRMNQQKYTLVHTYNNIRRLQARSHTVSKW